MNVECGSARDRLGRTLDDKYTLREVLGAGGTAVVFRAAGPDGTEVAVKMLHDHLSRSDEVCRRFVREGQLGNVLDHPGTVRVLDHGSSHDGCPYLVLELLEGESLEDRREKVGGRLDLWETLDYCDQLLAVLEVAHAKNVVHRDIKPSNLFLQKSGRLKVLDFGIARLVDDTSATATKTGQMVGTPAFMPPEQALSRPRDVDARTDIWAVGATLFTLLSGEHVHIAETSSEHLVKAATLHARSLAKALPGVPANVEALVARSLAFDKNERWPTASAMREELTRVRSDPGRRIGTTSMPPPERTPSSSNVPTIFGDRSSSSRMRAYADAPTTYSEPRMPLAPISGPISTPFGDAQIDSVANMALSSSPHDVPVHKRPWVLLVAIGSTLALMTTTVVALVLLFRLPPPVKAVSATPAPSVSVAELPVAAATIGRAGEAIEIADPAPAPTTVTPATTSTTTAAPRPPAAAPVKPQATYSPTASAPVAPKKPASRKDVYKPF